MEEREQALPAGDEEPDWLRGDAWQLVDAGHPPGNGITCYRLVCKTLRVALQPVEINWPNLIVRFRSGVVEQGGFFVRGAIPTRRPDSWVLPEFGRWKEESGFVQYEPTARVDPQLQAWQQETPELFYVEIFLDTPAVDNPRQVIADGRRRASSIVTMLDFAFGRRLLGAILCEEAGERFEDGHYNRRIGTENFGWEPQLNVTGVDRVAVETWFEQVVSPWMKHPEDVRVRFGLAAQWFQSALTAREPVSAFLHYWFVVEVLAVIEGTHIRQVRDRLTELTGSSEWGPLVGRLFGLRGKLVHGEIASVPTSYCDAAQSLAEVLLAAELGVLNMRQVESLRQHGGAVLEEASRPRT